MNGTTIRTIPLANLVAKQPRNGLYKSPQFQGIGNRWIKMKDLYGNMVIGNQPMDLVSVTKEEQDKFGCTPGDLLFGRTSVVLDGVGTCSIIGGILDVPVYESNLFRVRLDKDKSDPRFYLYYFRSPVGRRQVLSIARQTAAASITSSDLLRLEVPYPPLPTQRRIAQILGRLDDKIEVNRRINRTLEVMAQALFKHWFVDFGPFQAGPFVESELGLIPEGWRVRPLPEVIEVNPPRSLSKGQAAPYLEMSNMPTNSSRALDWYNRPFNSGMRFINGDVLYFPLTQNR